MKKRLALVEENSNDIEPFFRNRSDRLVFKSTQKILGFLSGLIGFDIGIVTPRPLERYKDFVPWDALRVLDALHSMGMIESFCFARSNYPDEPQGHTFVVTVAGEESFGSNGVGRDMLDKQKAIWPGIGEAIERWSSRNYVPHPKETLRSSYKDLHKNKIDIFSLAGFSDEFRKKGHKHFQLVYSEDTVFDWIKALSLTDNKDIYIPAQILLYGHSEKRQSFTEREPLLAPTISTGAAAGDNLNEAILGGLLEIIERDAFMIYWLNKLSPCSINIDSIPDERFEMLQDIARRYHLKPHLLYLETDVPIHTVLALLIDESGVGQVAVPGTASGFDFINTTYKALSDALTLRSAHRSLVASFEQKGKKNTAQNFKEQILYWSKKENLDSIHFLTSGEEKTYTDFITNERLHTSKDINAQLLFLIDFFKQEGLQVVYKEILDKKIRRELGGITSVSVSIPSFQPLYLDPTLPCLGGKRLETVPPKIGHTARKSPHTLMHPFL